MTKTEKLMGEAIRRLRFKSRIWKPVVEEGEWSYTVVDEAYLLVNKVRAYCGMESMSKDLFLQGWHFFDIFQEPYDPLALKYIKKIIWIDW